MFQREQQAAELQRVTGNSPGCGRDTTPPPLPNQSHAACWNALHPIRFHVLPLHQHFIQQMHPLPFAVKTETNPLDSDDSDIEVDVTSTSSSPPLLPCSDISVNANKSKISFSVESIIGRP